MRDKIIRIYWNDALPLDDAIESNLSKTQGLYYITHILKNKERGLYIGVAKNTNTIRNRLRDHKNHWLNSYNRGQIKVRIGHIIYPKAITASIIEHAESAIIFEMGNDVFFENTCKTKSYSYTDLYRIENEGDIFEIKPKIRMHEHEDVEGYFEEQISNYKNQPNSILAKWANDPNPVRCSGKPIKNSEKIEIRQVDNIDDVLKEWSKN